MKTDLLVIGAGSGGVAAARTAASHGINVAIVENDAFGGTCVNRGCVPKKLYVNGAQFSKDFKNATSYGWTFPDQPTFSWQTLTQNVANEIKRLNTIYKTMLETAGVHILKGHAQFISDKTVQINDTKIDADRILIAVGGKPFLPEIPGIKHAITSDQAFLLPELPQSIAIVGGGYIALEFAGIFNGLGVDTHLIIRKDTPLRGFDHEIRKHCLNELQTSGITVHTNANVTEIIKETNLTLHLDNGQTLHCDHIMMATGRKPNTEKLGLENTNVQQTESGHIQIDEWNATDSPNIFALGDASTHDYDLTPYAINEARDWVATQYGNEKRNPQNMLVPTAVFSQPPVATVGLREEVAIEAGYNVDIYSTEFRPMTYSLGEIQEKTFMKLVVDAESQRVLGIHLLGKDTPEMIQGFAVAMRAGATKQDVDRTVGLHPSSAEELVTMRQKTR